MNKKNISIFIKKMREKQGLTQEELANKVFVGREAVSKWERAKTIPDIDILIELSIIFNVSIDDMLIGEQSTNKRIITELYKEKVKLSKFLKLLIVVIIMLLFLFLIYYFFNSYKSFHIYDVKSTNSNYLIDDGILIKSNDRIYFFLGNIIMKNKTIPTSIELYYLDNGEKQSIIETSNMNIVLNDYKGYEEYFDFGKFEYILNNLYISVKNDDIIENIQLMIDEKYVNDRLIPSKNIKIADDNEINISNVEGKEFLKKIENKFAGKNQILSKKKNNLNLEYQYIKDSNILIITIRDLKNTIKEEIYYDIQYNFFTYSEYANGKKVNSFFYNGLFNCIIANCIEDKNKILLINDLINSI